MPAKKAQQKPKGRTLASMGVTIAPGDGRTAMTEAARQLDAIIRATLMKEVRVGGILWRWNNERPVPPGLPDQMAAKISEKITGEAESWRSEMRILSTENQHLRQESAALRESQQATAAAYKKLKRCLASERHRHNSTKNAHAATRDALRESNAARDRASALASQTLDRRDEAEQAMVTVQTELATVRSAWAAEVELLHKERDELRADLRQSLDVCDRRAVQVREAGEKVEAFENHNGQLASACEAEREAKAAAEAAIRTMEQELASLRRQKNTMEADLAQVRAGRDRERREYIEARRNLDATVAQLERDLRHEKRNAVHASDVGRSALEDSIGTARRFYEQIQVLESELRTNAAHLEGVQRQLADVTATEEARASVLITVERDNGLLRVSRDLWMNNFTALAGLFGQRERTIHAQITENIEIFRNFPEIARTLRAVRVMLFPPMGLLPTLETPAV